MIACTSTSSDTVGSSEQHATSDIDHMFKRPDGRYDIFCADGTTETAVTAEQINLDQACGGPHSSSSGGTVVDAGNDNSRATATCLNKNPIDATAFPYKKAAPKSPHACTVKELTEIGAYYKAHAADDDLVTTWPSSVSPACAQCVFTSDQTAAPATSWGPIVVGDDETGSPTFSVNRGGCIEQVSGSEACGRSYQQFQDCTIQACLVDCKTQSDFTQCRQDATVLTTSCKDAFASVKRDCGETKIGTYETACKGTTYTFEGPIKVACIGAP